MYNVCLFFCGIDDAMRTKNFNLMPVAFRAGIYAGNIGMT